MSGTLHLQMQFVLEKFDHAKALSKTLNTEQLALPCCLVTHEMNTSSFDAGSRMSCHV
jgi:hypothetical protein